MRRNLQQFFMALMVAFAGTASAQVSSDFEPSGMGSLSVRDEMILNNWRLPDMDVNPMSMPAIAGTSSMGVMTAGDKPEQRTGIITPFLSFNGTETLSFDYKLHRIFPQDGRRWFLVYVADVNTAPALTLVDSVEIARGTDVISYSKQIAGLSGNFAVYVNIKGKGYDSRVLIDNFYCSASDAGLSNGLDFNTPTNVFQSHDLSNTTISNPNHSLYGVNTTPATPSDLNTGTVNENDAPNGGMVSQSTDLTLYPNPTYNNVNLQFFSNETQVAQLEVYNINGSKVISMPATVNSGSNTVSLDVANLNAGNYFVSLVTKQGITNKKFTRIQ